MEGTARMMRETRMGLVLIAAAAALLIGWGAARAHDGYENWTQPDNGGSCCNDHDCRPVRASQDLNGQWTAWVEGREVPVPPNKIMRRPSPDGRSHWCGAGMTTYCFLPGEVRS